MAILKGRITLMRYCRSEMEADANAHLTPARQYGRQGSRRQRDCVASGEVVLIGEVESIQRDRPRTAQRPQIEMCIELRVRVLLEDGVIVGGHVIGRSKQHECALGN